MDGPGQPRFETLGENDLTEAQRKVYKEIASGPRAGVRGPFNVLLRSPELADRAQKLVLNVERHPLPGGVPAPLAPLE